MEKNQHNTGTGNLQNENGFSGNQPGQQLPADASQHQQSSAPAAEQNERHSESSFPQRDEETLGTP